MGFFKDFKNDMKQAVNELIPGNEEMVSEYDDEDMVNTLEEETLPEDEEYVNTMEQDSNPAETPKTTDTEEETFEDIDLADLNEFDLQEEDFEDFEEEPEESVGTTMETGHSESKRIPSDELAQLLAEAAAEHPVVEEPVAEEPASDEDTDILTLLGINAESPAEAVPVQEETPAPEPAATIKKEQQKAVRTPKQPSAESKTEKREATTDTAVRTEKKDKKAPARKQEENPMAEDKIIDITAMKGADTSAVQDTESGLDPEVSDSTTYISKGTRIEGNLFTDGSVDIIGSVEGDVNCYGKLIVSGEINGKVNASEIYSNAARITGEINSAGSVKIGVGSVIVGNVEAQSAVVAGAVNGDLDIKGPVIVDSTAVIMGNIKSRSVQINNGAVIEGFCSQSYSDVDVKSFFA